MHDARLYWAKQQCLIFLEVSKTTVRGKDPVNARIDFLKTYLSIQWSIVDPVASKLFQSEKDSFKH